MDSDRKHLVRIVLAYDQFAKRLNPDQFKTQEGRVMNRIIADIRDCFTPDMNVCYVNLRGEWIKSKTDTNHG